MPRYTKNTLQRIRERLSLTELIRPSVQGGKMKGRDFWACCPFHNEKSPSFHVREAEGYYHCFGCGAHGNAFDYIMETRGGTFSEAVEHLAGIAGVPLEKEHADPAKEEAYESGLRALKLTAQRYQQALQGAPLDYALKRGLSLEIIKKFQLGWATGQGLAAELSQAGITPAVQAAAGLVLPSERNKNQTYERFRNRLMFPIHDLRGNVVGFGGRTIDGGEPKYLNSAENEYFNKSRLLYNLHRARDHLRRENLALMVEGYMDVIGLWRHGIYTAVAPMGTAVTPEQITLLWRYHSQPIVCLDGDDAGRGAALRLAKRILPHLEPGKSLRFMYLPQGEDPDSFSAAHGKEGFLSLTKQTLSLDDVLWQDMAQDIDFATADARATVEATIDTLSGEIKHDTVRKSYRQTLRDKFWQTIKSQRSQPVAAGGSSTRIEGHLPTATNNPQNMLKNYAGKELQAQVLLCILLRFPSLLKKVEENFAEINYSNQRDKELKHILFQAMSENRLESESFHAYLLSRGKAQAAANLLKDTPIHQQATAENAYAFWLRYWQSCRQQDKELTARQAALHALQKDFSASSWEKVRAAFVQQQASGKSEGS